MTRYSTHLDTQHFYIEQKESGGRLEQFARVLNQNVASIASFMTGRSIFTQVVDVHFIKTDAQLESVMVKVGESKEEEKIIVVFDDEGNAQAYYLGIIVLETDGSDYKVRAVKKVRM